MAVSKLQWSMAAGVLALYAGLTVAQAPDPSAKLAPPVGEKAGAAGADRGALTAADGTWHANHEMRLRSDGNLPGQLRSFDAAGNLAPVRAVVLPAKRADPGSRNGWRGRHVSGRGP